MTRRDDAMLLTDRMEVATSFALLPGEAQEFLDRLPEFAATALVCDATAGSMLAECIKERRAAPEGQSFIVTWTAT